TATNTQQMAVLCDSKQSLHVILMDSTGAPYDLTGPADIYPMPYPRNAVPVTASSGDQANANADATLSGTSGKTTYIAGFICSSTRATSTSVVSITVSLDAGSTAHITIPMQNVAGATTQNPTFQQVFNPPLAATATNTAIRVRLPALGTGALHAACNAWGY